MARTAPKPSEAVQIAAIAQRYYLQDRSKKEIAREFGISRFKVARILQRAREMGIVDVHVRLPGIIDAELSDRLRCAYRLRRAIVVTASDASPEILRGYIGEVSANLLSEVMVEGDILGIGWGRTLTSMTGCLKELPRCTVVQLTGAIGSSDVLQSSIEMVRRVAAVSGGPAYPIYAPLIGVAACAGGLGGTACHAFLPLGCALASWSARRVQMLSRISPENS